MKSTGIIRNIDPLGRLVIPAELRKLLEIKTGDPIEILVAENTIVLRKYQKNCIFCNTTDKLIELENKKVCLSCARRLGLAVEKLD